MKAQPRIEKRSIWLLAAAFAVLLAAQLIVARPASAGGWAVITLHEWPGDIPVDTPLRITFSIRSHGQELIPDQSPTLHLRHPESGERLEVDADEGPRAGDYEAIVTLPLEGIWNWNVTFFGTPAWVHPLPPLTAVPGAAAAASPADPLVNARAMTAIGGLLAVVLGAAAFTQNRSRWSAGLALAGLALVVLAGVSSGYRTARAADDVPASASLSTAAYGQVLFQAKGCVVCHDHAEGREGYTGQQSNIGPDLTNTRLPADYIREWLADPAALKPKTVMPDLELSKAEIEVLAEFLTQDQ